MVLSMIAAPRKRRTLLLLGGALLSIALAAAVWYRTSPRPNIVLITLDTTRADRMGAYGYEQGLTRGFDDFAAQGVLFEQAFAPAPITLPSHVTMLSGLYPPEHGLRMNGSGRLPREIPYLPEILKEHGYETGAFIAAAAVLGSQYDLHRGFDTFDDAPPAENQKPTHHGDSRRDGKEVVDLALAWLKKRTDRPFFCWIHLYDAHAPNDPREDVYQQRFVSSPYDAGIAWEVEQFARVTAYLKEQNLDDDSVVIIAGDHGEGLDDHLETEHGMLVYNTTLQVPFVFVGPGHCQSGLRISSTVSLVDLTPTLLDMLEIPPPDRFNGRSLLGALHGESLDSRDCYAESETPYSINRWAPLRAVISDGWKYIQTTRPELYDLEHDPGELTNLADSDEEVLQRMQAALSEIQESFVPVAPQSADVSAKDLATLKTLGYVSGGPSASGSDDSSASRNLPDIKDFLPELATFERAKHLALEGKPAEAIPLLEQIVQATDRFPAADVQLGECLVQMGRPDEAEAIYRSVLARQPDFARVHAMLCQLLVTRGLFEQAEAEYRVLLKRNPDAATVHCELAQVLAQLQRHDDAVAEHQVALRLDPELVVAHVSLGQLLAQARRPVDAARCFEQALTYDPNNVVAHANLLFVLSQMGEYSKAIQHGERAAELDPNGFETRFNLGVLLVSRGYTEKGIAQLSEAQKLRPDDSRPQEHIQRAKAATRPRNF
jgi:arylsulfatase A-like enzyme/predicted Zn-dependent protease